MEFLETDFHVNRPPSRKISFRNNDGLLTDIRLSKYPKLNEHALNSLLSNFQKNPFANICNENSPNTRKTTYAANGLFQQNSSDDATNSFYDEIYDLWKNKQVLDKQDFYLYFFDLKFKDVIYPIFYMPLTIERTDEGGFAVEFDPILLINKKAIQYVNERLRNEDDKVKPVELPPRHVYLSEFEKKGDLLSFLQKTVNEICQCFGLRQFGKIDEIAATEINNGNLGLSNKCYFSIFDKSDEAILNDYEELLNIIRLGKEDKTLEIFSKLSADYLFGENPKIFTTEVAAEYDGQPVSNKLAYNSPIPLNAEQLKVLNAINKEGCDRIIIEGPPGTGKSHTITAIIYHALLNKKSVLMVSDKKEALDVVEEKINGVLDKMKLEDFIQNPIVRLGKKENTFAGIFKQENFDKIKDRANNYQHHKERIERDIKNTLNGIKKHIDDEVEGALVLDPARVQEILRYEKTYETLWDKLLDLDELQDTENSLELLKTLWRALRDLYEACHSLNSQFKINIIKTQLPLTELHTVVVSLDKDLIALHEKICSEYPSILLAKEVTKQNVDFLEDCLTEIEKLKKPVIGYLFSGKKVEALQKKFEEQFFVSASISLKHKRKHLQRELQLYKYCQKINENWNNIGLDLFVVLKENGLDRVSTTLQQMSQSIQTILSVTDELPATCQKMKLNIEDVNTVLSNSFLKFKEDDISELTEYLTNYFSVLGASAKIVRSDYTSMRAVLENCLVFKMTNILDESVVDFRLNKWRDTQELIKTIKSKRKIPRDYLQKLVTAFPCLIVSVRELGEFIPLEPNLFDIVIIDEASQVSIAQAFPAILRGKKVVVLGDEKQYSNVKSHNAGTEQNNLLFNRVNDAFKRSISNLDINTKEKVKDKVESFNIKHSILDFIKSIPNYPCMLKKHFRGYMEIIGYSNETFYKGSLQVMKIRGRSISDVVQFYFVEPYGPQEKYKNTNQAEIDFILAELQRLKNENFQGSIGIITPFTNQQKLISSRVYDSEHWTFYQNQFKLKVMTFDSCQGDEKDIIYYSMVERPDEDILRHIFPIDSKGVGEVDGKLKAQRLNVGFSRARESIRFVLSKKPENIRGAVGKAFLWYQTALEKPDDFEVIKKTDPKSHGKESELYNLVKQTPFYKENESQIEIIPQFGIGKYIKQLDIFAKIPDYVSDFLFIYNGEEQTRMIILEYDGYENHFEDSEFINKFNYDRFYVEGDVERRKAIESYGYPFIRMNKFLLRDDPISFLNEQLEVHCKKKV
jgi:hypothetical protein